MTRIPELERELRRAAAREEARDTHGRRSWLRRGFLVALAGLASSGVAWAAVSLIETGDSVPAGNLPGLGVDGRDERFRVAAIRAPDPQGGPDWGIGTFDGRLDPQTGAKADASGPSVRCVVVARVVAGRLGILGRDGAFQDDGRFHPLQPGAEFTGGCAETLPTRGFALAGLGPPVPASGYSGSPGGRIGGCREPVDLNGPTVSPQTRRQLRDVPVCAPTSLRHVIAGYAGRDAATATITIGGSRRTQRLRAADDGAYLFVLPASISRPAVTIRRLDGSTCRPDTGSGACFAG